MRCSAKFPRAAWLTLALATLLSVTQAQAAAIADFDGDGKADLAVWRQTDDNWYINLSGGGVIVKNWGGHIRRQIGNVTYVTVDTLVPADYDGDGRADLAVYRDFEGNWYIARSSDGAAKLEHLDGFTAVPWSYVPGYRITDIYCPEPSV